MSREVARDILQREMGALRLRPYDYWKQNVARDIKYEALGVDGVKYDLKLTPVWDSGKDIRVTATIVGGAVSASFAMTDSFIVRPDGTFI